MTTRTALDRKASARKGAATRAARRTAQSPSIGEAVTAGRYGDPELEKVGAQIIDLHLAGQSVPADPPTPNVLDEKVIALQEAGKPARTSRTGVLMTTKLAKGIWATHDGRFAVLQSLSDKSWSVHVLEVSDGRLMMPVLVGPFPTYLMALAELTAHRDQLASL